MKKRKAMSKPGGDPRSSAVFVNPVSPIYKIDWRDNLLSVRGPRSDAEWIRIAAIMQEHQISALKADQLSDAGMDQISRLDHVTGLQISGSNALSDKGAQYVARMPQLVELVWGGSNSLLTDHALESLRDLSLLKRLNVSWTRGISDIGIRNLASCDALQDVNLMGTNTGDGAIQALAGKLHLRRFSSGKGVTDAGLLILHQFPIFKVWHGGETQIGLMDFQAKPNQLIIDGVFTNQGLHSLVGLDGLFALILFRNSSAFTSDGLAPLRQLPNLRVLGCGGERCDNEAMRHIAAMPGLRKLLAQDAVADDTGFEALSHSQSIEFIWGRSCPNFSSRGFAALAKMPALRGIGLSCKFVDDNALSLLPRFPALQDLMPMDMQDAGFRHIGLCKNLRGLWCMYCQDTGDAATEHIAGLRLRTYYAGMTKITDRSLDILAQMATLERLDFWQCPEITDSGVARLAALPELREITFERAAKVTPQVVAMFPPRVHVQYVSEQL